MHPQADPTPPTPTPTPAPVPLPPVVPCPGLACLACGNPVGCQRLHRTAWAWAHLGVRPAGCPGLLVPAADLVYLVHLLPAYRHARHYLGKPASSGLLKAVWQVSGGEFAELAWMARIGPPGAPATPPAPRHRLRVVGACVPGAVVGTAVLLGTVAAGGVVVGTAAGAVVVGAGRDGDVVAVPGARVAGGADRSPPATTTPTEVLPPCRGWLPTKLASGWLATASTPVIATTAIPKASTAATATRCQRIGWGCPWLAPSSLAPSSLAASSLAPAWSPTRRTSERRATLGGRQRVGVHGFGRGHQQAHHRRADQGPFDPEEGRDHGPADRGQRASEQLGNAELFHLTPGGSGWGRRRCRVGAMGAAEVEPSRCLESPHPSDPGRLAPGIPRSKRRPRSLGQLQPGRPVAR
jgi:hypothetical protein